MSGDNNGKGWMADYLVDLSIGSSICVHNRGVCTIHGLHVHVHMLAKRVVDEKQQVKPSAYFFA